MTGAHLTGTAPRTGTWTATRQEIVAAAAVETETAPETGHASRAAAMSYELPETHACPSPADNILQSHTVSHRRT